MQTKNTAQEMTRTQRVLAALAGIILLIVIPVGCASMMGGGGGSSSSSPSRGQAEIACERAVQNEAGKVKGFTYTDTTDLGGGDFTLYGTVFSDSYGQLKFICSVEDAMSGGDRNATATAEVGK